MGSCSTKKNTLVSRGFHNLTARFNGYYYSCENINEGVYKIEKNNKDDFEKTLPIFIYPNPDKAKLTFAEFDLAIKKSSLCIQKHAIKNGQGTEIASAGNWIDNNWINIGISHVYKRDFFSGIEAFEYVTNTYNKSKDKFTAMIWLTKAYNEIGSVSNSEPILNFLNNQKKLPNKLKNEFLIVYADYYLRRGQNTEAIAKLMDVTRNSSLINGLARKKRARYLFIVAQLSEKAKDYKRAVEYYKKTIKLKPTYEFILYSKIKIARLVDVNSFSSEKTKKDLLKMTKEFKNTDYFDVIYYTLGEIEEKEKNINQALTYYKKSAQTSQINQDQKAMAYLKLGEINFDLTNYQAAESYYDSTIAAISKDNINYETIFARKKTLETLVGYIKNISREDSLQKIARMSETDQNLFIDNMMLAIEKEAALKQKELEAAKENNNGSPTLGNTGSGTDFIAGGASFYFYNANTTALGVSDFTKKWGNRKWEDNWRRSNKALVIEEEEGTIKNGGEKGKTAQITQSKKTRDYYKKDLPLTDSLFLKSTNKIIKSYYFMGSIYKEELNNTKKAIASFEELNKRYPQHKYSINTYYILYRSFLKEKNQEKADYYKNKILTEFPESEFALLIKNPEYANDLSTKKSEVELFYNTLYSLYKTEDFEQSYIQAKEGLIKYGKNDYASKIELIKAISYGKIKGIDSLEFSLKILIAKYPKEDVTLLADDILLSIKKQKNPDLYKNVETKIAEKDTFMLNLDAEHFLVLIAPDELKLTEALKINLGSFNNIYYSDSKLIMSSNLFGNNKQLIIIKTFNDAKKCLDYLQNINNDPDVFKGDAKKELIDVFPILSTNLPLLYKTKNIEGYKLFYLENYKKIK